MIPHNIKLYPENAVYDAVRLFKEEFAEIFDHYSASLSERNLDCPLAFKMPSKDADDFDEITNTFFDYIENAAYQGDIDAEKALNSINKLFNIDFLNYFMVAEKLNVNIKLAERGDIYSQGMLGDRYYYGKGVERDFVRAVAWYTESAKQGVGLSQFNLAGCYETGCGIAQNKEESIKWYKKAADNGVREAKRALVRIEHEKNNDVDSLIPYMPTYRWEEERKKFFTDEHGVEYSEDGKRLLRAPQDIKNYSVKEGTLVICDCAFYDCGNLESLVIADSVLVIGRAVFKGCLKLKSVSLPETLIELGDSAFQYTGLKSIDIPNGVKTIGKAAFRECYDLETITIPQSVIEIGNGIFIWAKKLKSIVIDPDNGVYDSRNNCNAIIEKRTDALIAGCNNTIIPEGVVSIGEKAFWGMDNLVSIEIPDGVKEINERAFWKCEKLSSVVIADTVEEIGRDAFEECRQLKAVKLSSGLVEIGDGAFCGCPFEEVELPCGLKTIGEKAFRSLKVKSLVIPESVNMIKDGAFALCRELESVILPKNLKKIANMVFYGCINLSDISIPNGVKIIGKDVFKECKKLSSIIIPKEAIVMDDAAYSISDVLSL